MIGGIPGISSSFNPSQKAHGTNVLNASEKKELEELKKRDSDVRTYVQTHLAAAGPYAKSISIQYRQGPDGRIYIVSGEVHIDTSEVPGNPDATISKAAAIRRAAYATADLSVQDHQAAAAASRIEAKARMEKAEETRGESDGNNVLLKDMDNYEDTKAGDTSTSKKINMQISGPPVSAYSRKESVTGEIIHEVV